MPTVICKNCKNLTETAAGLNICIIYLLYFPCLGNLIFVTTLQKLRAYENVAAWLGHSNSILQTLNFLTILTVDRDCNFYLRDGLKILNIYIFNSFSLPLAVT